MKLTIVVPVYNEEATLDRAMTRLRGTDFGIEVEFVVVDDGSTDASPAILAGIDDPRLRVLRLARNRGKGAAVRSGAEAATGDYVTVCDADLEYDPADLARLVAAVRDEEAEVVYGTRTFGSHTAYSFWYVQGNRAVTTFANVLFDCYLSDLETCFKLMPTALYRSLNVRSHGFGMEAEITGKLLRAGYRPYEVPISYRARSRAAGKKLTWRDGVEALWILARIRLTGR